MEQLGTSGVAVACSPSGSNGRSGTQRGGLGCCSGDETGRCVLIMEGHEWKHSEEGIGIDERQ